MLNLGLKLLAFVALVAIPMPSESKALAATKLSSAEHAGTSINPGIPSSTATGISTSVTLTITTPSSLAYGQTVNGYAQVSATDNVPLNGALTFYDGAVNICVITVSQTVNCPASTGTGFAVGAHILTAVYSGDATHAGSSSNAVTVTVLPDTTTASITSSSNPATFGQSVNFIVTVDGSYAIPNGMVILMDGSSVIGTTSLDANGTAVLSTSALSTGAHAVIAVYGATQAFDASTSSVLSEVVVVPSTATMISSSANPATSGESVTLTANVAAVAQSAKVPTGTATFLDGSVVLGTASLNSSGLATYTTAMLAAGSHNITASYSGDGAFSPSLSAAFSQVVNASSQAVTNNFTIGVSPIFVAAGKTASVLVTVTPVNGFNQAVQLECSNLPSEATCAFASSVIPAGGGTTALQLSTLAPGPCGSSIPYNQTSALPFGVPVIAGLVMLFVPRRRRVLSGLLALIAICGSIGVSGCSACTDLGTRPGNYTIKVTGVSTGATPVTNFQQVRVSVGE